MGNAIGYIKLLDRRMSEKEQRKVIEDYCAANEIDIDGWCEKAEFNDVVYGEEIQAIKIDRVVVAGNDFVSTDVCEYFAYKGILRRKGVELIAVTEEYGAYKLYANIMNDLVMKMADIERADTARKVSGGRKAKAQRGGYSGGQPPMGYKAEGGKLVVNPEEAEIVKFIIRRKRSGKTMMGTVDALNEKGYKTRGGKKFLISSVQSIWNNEMFYQGWYRYGKDSEWVRGEHEPLVK